MTDNLALWNKVCRVPEEHLKGFKRGGGFSGTAIKPMWSIKTMTEHLGPCGTAWGTHMPKFKVVPVDKEVLVYCTLPVWIGKHENVIVGVGGDKVVKYVAANSQYNRPERWENDDEAFKKAYTDALTNALKLLGVGADIHMGLWDGNKYVDEGPEPAAKPAGRPALTTVSGDTAKPKAKSREPFERVEAGIYQIEANGTHEELTAWYKNHVKEIEAWSADWHQQIMQKFSEARETLNQRFGPPPAKQKEIA